MSVAPSWVLSNGGIFISRLADDGSSQILDTKFTGLDSSGNMIFTGTSPNGLSIFALISVRSAEATVTPAATPATTKDFGTTASLVLMLPVLFFSAMIMIRQK